MWQAVDRRLYLGRGVRGIDLHQRALLGNVGRNHEQPAAAGLCDGLGDEGDQNRERREDGGTGAPSKRLDGRVSPGRLDQQKPGQRVAQNNQ